MARYAIYSVEDDLFCILSDLNYARVADAFKSTWILHAAFVVLVLFVNVLELLGEGAKLVIHRPQRFSDPSVYSEGPIPYFFLRLGFLMYHFLL